MLRQRLLALRRRYGFVRQNIPFLLTRRHALEPPVGTWTQIRDVLAGYTPLERSLYRRSHGTSAGCTSTYERDTRLAGLNGEHGYLLGNKLLFAHAMRSAGFPHPELFGFTHEGVWRWLDGGRQRLESRLDRGERIVVKPVNGRKGTAIEFVSDARALEAARPVDVLATAFVQQAPYAADIFGGSVNTVRVVTVRAEGAPALVAMALHRFGLSTTGGVDNTSVGALVTRIDLETGIMDKAFQITGGTRVRWLERHPETDRPITGVRIPDWGAVKTLCLDLCAAFPFLRYVGWDIAVTQDGPVVIEGNAHPSLRASQVYEPILHDPRLRPFFAQRFDPARLNAPRATP